MITECGIVCGILKYFKETCPSAILSIRNLTLTYLGLNLGYSDEKPETNHLSYLTTVMVSIFI
jgi:hypothetical protein